MAFGLTDEGLVPMTATDIIDDIQRRIWDTIAPTLDLSDRTYEGQLIRIVAYHLSLLWQLAQVQGGAFNLDNAFAAALDAICLLTGTFRAGAAYAVVPMLLLGDLATAVPEGRSARVPNGPQFVTLDDATIDTAITAWATATLYAEGDIRTSNGHAFVCITAGTSHATTGPQGPPGFNDPNAEQPSSDIVDGTVHWAWLGEGTAMTTATAKATVTGVISANTGTITEIVTPTGGWLGVNNLSSATPGRDQMTDAELRIQREIDLATPGTSPVNAIRAAVADLAGVFNVRVFNNPTDGTVDGMPPHSVEVLVQGGVTQDILDTIFANVAAGIATHGNTTGSVTDSQGTVHTVKFTRPVEVPIYVDITLLKDPELYPADGNDQIRNAVVAMGSLQLPGYDAVASRITAAAFGIVGVLDVTATLIDDAPAPSTSTTIPIAKREIATYALNNISVNESDAVP